MGTLGNQPERDSYRVCSQSLTDFMQEASDIANTHDVKIEAVIQAKLALELARQNNISIQNGNYIDEHADGIGKILSKIATALEAKI